MTESSVNYSYLLKYYGKNSFSFVWSYFGLESNCSYRDTSIVVCHLCFNKLAYNGNTMNMFHHLGKHKEIITKSETPQIIDITQSHDDLIYPPEFKKSKSDLTLVEFWSKTKRSVVWEYFGFYATAEGEYVDRSEAVCKLCKTCLRYTGNTTNLANHLARYHGVSGILASHDHSAYNTVTDETKERVNQILKAATSMQRDEFQRKDGVLSHQCSIIGATSSGDDDSLENNKSYSGANDHVTTTMQDGFGGKRSVLLQMNRTTLNAANISPERLSTVTSAICNYLLYEKLTLNHVLSKGFVSLISSLEPLYNMPSLDYFKESFFIKRYLVLKDRIKSSTFNTSQRHILTMKKWCLKVGSDTKEKFYNTLILTYMTANLETKKHVLCTIESEIDSQIISGLIFEWNLKNVVVVGERPLRYNDDVIFLPCIAEVLTKSLRKCYTDTSIKTILTKLSDDSVQKVSDKDYLPFNMAQVISHENPFAIVKFLQRCEICNLTEKDIIKDLLIIIQSFETALNMLNSPNSTSSLILPTLYKLIHKQLLLCETDSNEIKEVKTFLAGSLKNTFLEEDSSCLSLIQLATVIDPRLKSLDWIEEKEKETLFQLLHKEALDSFWRSEELMRVKIEPRDDELSSERDQDGGDDLGDELSFLADVLEGPKKGPLQKTPEEAVKSEIGHYIMEQGAKGVTNALSWWATRADSYPILSKIAFKYLCIPATGENARNLKYPICISKEAPSMEEVDMLMFVYNNSDWVTQA